MVVGSNNGVVGLTGFSDKKMSGLLFGPQKSGRNNGVVVWRGSTVQTTFPWKWFIFICCLRSYSHCRRKKTKKFSSLKTNSRATLLVNQTNPFLNRYINYTAAVTGVKLIKLTPKWNSRIAPVSSFRKTAAFPVAMFELAFVVFVWFAFLFLVVKKPFQLFYTLY